MLLEGLRKTQGMRIQVNDVMVEILSQKNPEYKPTALIL
jgi:hypothetical protein